MGMNRRYNVSITSAFSLTLLLEYLRYIKGMMSILIYSSICICLSLESLKAAEKADFSLRPDRDGKNVFVGNYGEILRFPENIVVEPEMHGPIEVIRFHPDKFKNTLDFDEPLYCPKPEDYMPENFARMKLMQLVVIPKSVPGGFKTLKDLRTAKEKELSGNRLSYSFPIERTWPQDTFVVSISSPYNLIQIYTQDKNNLIIFTSGGDYMDPPYAYREISNSLYGYVVDFRRSTNDFPLSHSNYPALVKLFIILTFIWIIIDLVLSYFKLYGRFRLSFRTFLIFSPALVVIGWSILGLTWKYELDWLINEGSILLVSSLIMPFVCIGVSSLFGNKDAKYIFWRAVKYNIIPALFGFGLARENFQNHVADFGELQGILALQSILGIVNSICFGLYHKTESRIKQPVHLSPGNDSLICLTLALYILTPGIVRADGGANPIRVNIGGIDINAGPMGDTPEIVAWKIIQKEKGVISLEELKKKVKSSLREDKAFPYDFQRVEVTGVFSTDNTDISLPDTFDKQFKMSFANLHGGNPGAFKWTVDRLRDLVGYFHDMTYNPSDRTFQVLEELKGKEINELIAHSWGSESVYAAILNGYITPPKKLIIVGVPDFNKERWETLARYTGIEVHVVGFQYDKAQLIGGAVNVAQKYLMDNWHPLSSEELERLWQTRCKEAGRICMDPQEYDTRKFTYDVNIRPPDIPKDLPRMLIDFIRLDHDRFKYYYQLYLMGYLNKSLEELSADDLKLIERESNRILEKAREKAAKYLAEANQKARVNDLASKAKVLRDGIISKNRNGNQVGENRRDNITSARIQDLRNKAQRLKDEIGEGTSDINGQSSIDGGQESSGLDRKNYQIGKANNPNDDQSDAGVQNVVPEGGDAELKVNAEIGKLEFVWVVPNELGYYTIDPIGPAIKNIWEQNQKRWRVVSLEIENLASDYRRIYGDAELLDQEWENLDHKGRVESLGTKYRVYSAGIDDLNNQIQQWNNQCTGREMDLGGSEYQFCANWNIRNMQRNGELMKDHQEIQKKSIKIKTEFKEFDDKRVKILGAVYFWLNKINKLNAKLQSGSNDRFSSVRARVYKWAKINLSAVGASLGELTKNIPVRNIEGSGVRIAVNRNGLYSPISVRKSPEGTTSKPIPSPPQE